MVTVSGFIPSYDERGENRLFLTCAENAIFISQRAIFPKYRRVTIIKLPLFLKIKKRWPKEKTNSTICRFDDFSRIIIPLLINIFPPCEFDHTLRMFLGDSIGQYIPYDFRVRSFTELRLGLLIRVLQWMVFGFSLFVRSAYELSYGLFSFGLMCHW